MPELEDLLAAEAARYDVRQPPIADIRHRRQRRTLARSGGALAALTLLGAAMLLLPQRDNGAADLADRLTGSGANVRAVRTEPDGRGLVAAYTGGVCDGPSSLLVQESETRVDIAVQVLPRPGDDENTVCPLAGIGRTVSAELAEPLGDRDVFIGGRRVQPFDGADLVVPTRLPKRFVLLSEDGNLDGSDWTQTYGLPGGERGEPCRPGERALAVSTGPRVLEAFAASYFSDEGPIEAGDGPARLYSQSGGPVQYLGLQVAGQPVSVSYSSQCGGPAPSVTELLDIAEGLLPTTP